MTKRQRRTEAFDAQLLTIINDVGVTPLTVRQIYYLALAAGLVEKDQREARYVTRRVLALRERGDIPWDAIIDPTREVHQVTVFSDVDAAMQVLRDTYRRDWWQAQPYRVELWVESDSTRGFLQPVADQFRVPIISTRGQSSSSLVYAAAQAAGDRPVKVLYVGDFDPTGVMIPQAVFKRLRDFGVKVKEFARIAVTPEQIVELGLPGTPDAAKQSDMNFAKFATLCRREGLPVEGVQAEAIPPTLLRDIVADAIEDRMDVDAFKDEAAREEEDRARLRDFDAA